MSHDPKVVKGAHIVIDLNVKPKPEVRHAGMDSQAAKVDQVENKAKNENLTEKKSGNKSPVSSKKTSRPSPVRIDRNSLSQE